MLWFERFKNILKKERHSYLFWELQQVGHLDKYIVWANIHDAFISIVQNEIKRPWSIGLSSSRLFDRSIPQSLYLHHCQVSALSIFRQQVLAIITLVAIAPYRCGREAR